MPGAVGTIGGRYALGQELARGGMATVHLARQSGAAGFARIVAVKRLHERFARDPELVAMFLDEARLVARVRHPNVVATIDVVAEHDELFIVMEYVHGESLQRLLGSAGNRRRAPIGVACAIVAAMLHGLHAAHEARGETGEPLGLVHRDVSPHNVLVGADGIARVIDFGIATAAGRIQTTQDGQLKGKLSYMAPEQVTSAPIDRRTDVYAAGVVLWEALTGEKLVQGPSEAAVLQRVLEGPRPAPSTLAPEVPPALDAIVLRALASDPDARFPTAREMALALEAAGSLASAAEIAAWVRARGGARLDARAQVIASIEAWSSSANRERAVDSLRRIAHRAPPFHSTAPTALGSPAPAAPPAARAVIAVAFAAAAGLGLLALVIAGFAFVGMRASSMRAPRSTTATTSATSAMTPVLDADACPEGMVRIPGGRFFMGSDADRPDEKPAHHVTVHASCMDRFEVTADAYRACSDRGDCKRAGVTNAWAGMTKVEARTYDPLCNAVDEAHGNHPVNCVDWSMADRFCRANGKRLPTEAEWEFAARGSDGRRFPWGDAPPSAKHLNACGPECVLWSKEHGVRSDGSLFAEDDGFATTAPVGSFPLGASRWGVEDIVGNVWEWVADWYGPYTSADAVDPSGPATGVSRVVRGGAWNGAQPDWVRPSFRFHLPEGTRSHGVGFRCAR